MKVLITLFIFFTILFIYIHILFQLKQSNELEAMANSLMEIINGNGLNILEKVED